MSHYHNSRSYDEQMQYEFYILFEQLLERVTQKYEPIPKRVKLIREGKNRGLNYCFDRVFLEDGISVSRTGGFTGSLSYDAKDTRNKVYDKAIEYGVMIIYSLKEKGSDNWHGTDFLTIVVSWKE